MLTRFAPISKMESQSDGTLKVWGVASTEAVDSDGEVIKAAAMKEALPDYMAWGAIREMHQPIAAGTCLEAGVNDETGQTLICAHIVDEGSIKKVKTGVLKGFSIGGVATATDPLNKTIVTALKLNEISLVDKPANPEAVISLWKADKMNAPAHAAQTEQVTGEQLGNEIEALVKGGDLSLGEVLAAVRKAAKGKKETKCMHDVKLGDACDKCDGGVAVAKAASTEDDEPDEFCKKDYTDKEREDMAASGEAEEDGSYPIKNKKDLKNAITAIGRSKDQAKTKKHIKARAKALGLESELPDDWKETTKAADGGENADEPGKGEGKEKGTVAPAGGSNEPAGDEGKTKAAATGNGAASVAKTEGNAPVKPVSPGTQGAPNATNAQPQMGTEGTMNPQASTPMLQKPKIGDLVTLSWGEDEVGGHIAEIKDLPEGGSEVVVKNGDAHLAVDSSKLTHHELNGDKVHWKVTAADNADFTAAKAAQTARITAALKKAFKGESVLQKGMWTVGNWADITQSLVWLMKDIKWEAACEDDSEDDEFVRRIASVVKSLGELMLEYAEDQLKEIFTGVCDPDNIPDFIIELAAKPGELQKFAEGGVGVGHVLKKAFGAAGVQVDTDYVQKAIEKAVAAQVGTATAKLEKAHGEHVATLEKRIKELEDQPQEVRGVLKGTAINKDSSNLADGSGQEVPPVMKNGQVDEAATAIKKAFAQPQSFNRLSTQ